jgi:hypothetical protein
MTTPDPKPFDERIEAYLDDRMEPEHRRAFEAEMSQRPDLAAQVKGQQAIDASLRRSMQPPPDLAIAQIADEAVNRSAAAASATAKAPAVRSTSARSVLQSRLALAASLAAMLTGAWLIWRVVAPAPAYDMPWRSIEAVYRHEVDSGFKPQWICENDEEFRQSFYEEFMQPLTLEALPEGTKALGMSYANTISRRTLLLLARTAGKPVIVFIDRAEVAGGDPEPPAGLNLFHRRIGPLVLYELTPLGYPSVMDSLVLPDS